MVAAQVPISSRDHRERSNGRARNKARGEPAAFPRVQRINVQTGRFPRYANTSMHSVFRISVFAVALAGVILCAQVPPKEVRAEGIPPRATPSDYQAHKQVGKITIGAEFAGHFVTTPDKTLTTDDYVIVEVGLFGPPGTKLDLSTDEFALRINQKKNPSPSQSSVMVNSSLRDPDWQPPDQQKDKPKTMINSSGNQNADSGPPPPVHIPLELQRAMAERALKASLEEGERPLPQAGLLYFRYTGKDKGIHTIELIYNGPAGKATIELQPVGQ